MLNKVLENVSTIAIGGHVRPDGDCVGSCVGLGQYIRENYSDKTVDIYLKDIPESFHFLKGTETILESVDDEEKVYDLFIPWTAGIQTDWSILKRYLIKQSIRSVWITISVTSALQM